MPLVIPWLAKLNGIWSFLLFSNRPHGDTGSVAGLHMLHLSPLPLPSSPPSAATLFKS